MCCLPCCAHAPQSSSAGQLEAANPPTVEPAVDGRLLLLFDLNGVLTDHTPARMEGKYRVRQHVVRPHIEELLRLLPDFRLGIFSSATRRTVNNALGAIHRELRAAAAARGGGARLGMLHPVPCRALTCHGMRRRAKCSECVGV